MSGVGRGTQLLAHTRTQCQDCTCSGAAGAHLWVQCCVPVSGLQCGHKRGAGAGSEPSRPCAHAGQLLCSLCALSHQPVLSLDFMTPCIFAALMILPLARSSPRLFSQGGNIEFCFPKHCGVLAVADGGVWEGFGNCDGPWEDVGVLRR